jgi:hypothetical protein
VWGIGHGAACPVRRRDVRHGRADTGDGAFFDNGTFHRPSNETVTIAVDWCSSCGVITAKTVTFSSTIASDQEPRLTETDDLARGGAVLKVDVGGDDESGAIDNVGFILLGGHGSANGNRHFKNLSAAGG